MNSKTHLMDVFREEAGELIDRFGVLAESLEAASENERHAVVEELFRVAHNLKGASRTLGHNAMEAFIGQHFSSAIWLSLFTPFAATINKKLSNDDIVQPGHFFTRYAMRWMLHSLDHGDDPRDAFFTGAWYHNLKLVNFLWLNWMECTHPVPPQNFDDARFFQGDEAAVKAAYKAAVS